MIRLEKKLIKTKAGNYLYFDNLMMKTLGLTDSNNLILEISEENIVIKKDIKKDIEKLDI
jgi:hypothetical protein